MTQEIWGSLVEGKADTSYPQALLTIRETALLQRNFPYFWEVLEKQHKNSLTHFLSLVLQM